MKILVTGANGHLGANVVRELVARGHHPVALVRPSADLRALRGLPVQIVPGDVLDAASVDAAATGVDAVLNLAATYKTGVADADVIVAPAVQAIRNVLRAAARHGVRRVVHTSSTVAVGTSDDPSVVLDERTFNDRPIDAYYKAKTVSEREAWALAGELGVPMVVLNPSGLLGPWDYRVTPTSGFVEGLARGGGQTVPGGLNLVDVRDCAWLHVEALTKGEPGERYLCVGANLELRQIGQVVRALSGRRVWHVPLPRSVVLSFVGLGESVARWRGVEAAQATTTVAESASRWARYDPSKTAAAFGFRSRPIEDTLRDALRWAVFCGRLDPSGFTFDVAPQPDWTR